MISDNVIHNLIVVEIKNSREKYGNFQSTHEGYAVIKEEMDELWDCVKSNDLKSAQVESCQVAAMAIKFIQDLDSMRERSSKKVNIR